MNPLRALGVFGAGVILDVVWARYTLAVQARRAGIASALAVAILVLGAIGLTAYVDEIIYLIPAAAGAGVGTFVAVRRG